MQVNLTINNFDTMNYEEICKYVFREQRIDWELHNIKSRKREIVDARYISMYLGNWFFPKMSADEATFIFGIDRTNFYAGLRCIKKLLFSDKQMRTDIDKYLAYISRKIAVNRYLTVNAGTVIYKLKNKRIILKKRIDAYEIRIKKLQDKTIEEQKLVVTYETMEGIFNAYQILNK